MVWIWIVGALMTAFGTSVVIDCLPFSENKKGTNKVSGSIRAFFIGFVAGPFYWLYQLTHMDERRREMQALKAERMEKRRALAQRDEDEVQAAIIGMHDAFDRMDGEIERWEKSLTDPPVIKDQRLREEHRKWQAKFDEAEAPHKAARQREQERKEQQERIDSARAALQELREKGPVVFESGAKATFYEHGRQLFNLGAKLILGHLDDTERNALDFYLQSKRREIGLNTVRPHIGRDYSF
jgi:hypothetical protein